MKKNLQLRPKENETSFEIDENRFNDENCDVNKATAQTFEHLQLRVLTPSCLVVSAKVNRVGTDFVIDTGPPVSIISDKDMQEFKIQEPLQRVYTTLRTADGTLLDVKGKVSVLVEIGAFTFKQTVIVANLNGPGILGLDFLERNHIDILIRDRALKIHDKTIKLKSLKSTTFARITLKQEVNIPPRSEMIIDGKLQGILSFGQGLVEPVEIIKGKGLLVAKTLIDTKKNETSLSVINLNNKEVKLNADSIIGTVHEVESVVSNKNQDREVCIQSEIPEHLKILVENLSPKLSQEQVVEIHKFIIEFQDVFVGPDGKFDKILHEIDTGNAKPIKQPPRRVFPKQKEIIETELKKMLDEIIIEPSNSPWASPVCLVKKKDGSVRFCVDFRRVNSVTRKDAYPLPRISDCLNALNCCSWFHCIDMACGYWQVKVLESDRAKTAFATHRGLYQFCTMPFGLTNAPACFQRLVETVFGHLQWQKCLCYLDIIIFGNTFESAFENLRTDFRLLREANLKLKAKKCSLFKTEISFLGHVVSSNGVSCDPAKVDCVKNWPRPLNVSEIRSFLGFASYYRRFIPDFATIAEPLTKLTRKSNKFVWSEQTETSFNTLKNLLIEAPVLAYPDSNSTFVLDCDASLTGIGGVLSQLYQGEERAVAYASKTLNRAQRNYCVTKRELLAVVTFVKHFKHFLNGTPFIIRTDHASLTWLRNFKEPEGVLARWISTLETYNFSIQYRSSAKHSNADGLSRIPKRKCKNSTCPECFPQTALEKCEQFYTVQKVDTDSYPVAVLTQTSEDSKINQGEANWLETWSNERLIELQANDPDISDLIEMKRNSNERPHRAEILGKSQGFKILWRLWDFLEIQNNILIRRLPNSTQLVAPSEIRQTIFEQLHKNRIAGHFGRDRTLAAVKKRFYWPEMSSDVARWCKNCDLCARCKPGPGQGRAPLTQSEVSFPLERIAIDIVGPLPITRDGNEYIIKIGDYFTKWKEAYASPNHTAQTVADLLLTQFICRFGCPLTIHTDQGREFESS